MSPGLRLLWQCLPGRAALGGVASWTALEAAPALLSGIAVAGAVDAAIVGHGTSAALWLSALAGAVAMGSAATGGLYRGLSVVVEGMRDEMTRRVAAGAVARLATTGRPGDGAVSQLVDQIDQVRALVSTLLRTLRSTVAPIVAAGVGLLVLDRRLTVAVAVPVLAGLALYAVLVPRIVARQRAAARAGERLGARSSAVLAGHAALRGLGALPWARAELHEAAVAAGVADLRLARVEALGHVIVAVGTAAPLLAVLFWAEPLLSRGAVSTGAVVGATTYVLTVLAPAMASVVLGAGGSLTQLVVVLDQLATVSETPEPPVARPTTALDPAAADALVARGLTFSHRAAARPVIDGLDLRLRRGELLAVIGPSGAGKSTLAELIRGLRQPTAGYIGIQSGTGVYMAPQEAYAFAGTLRENLLSGYDLTLSPPCDDRLRDVVAVIGLDGLADRVGGLDGRVADSAVPLSDAERQQIALARAALSAAETLVLDEATSHLDVETEARIVAALRRGGRTLVVISHHVQLAARADRVLLFDGRDTDLGTHSELLHTSKAYRDILAVAELSSSPATTSPPHHRGVTCATYVGRPAASAGGQRGARVDSSGAANVAGSTGVRIVAAPDASNRLVDTPIKQDVAPER